MKKLITIILTIFFVSCSSKSNYPPSESPDNIVVEYKDGVYSIIPKCYEMDKALVLYPGGLVEPDAYIPFSTMLADQLNLAVFIQKMPFNLAIFGKNKVKSIMADYDYIDIWYFSGHSLGGVMASSFIYENPGLFDAMIFLASYPMEKKTLRDRNLPVLSIRGSEDGLVENEKIIETSRFLPADSVFFEIHGGNHAQFGSYGSQKGDHVPQIEEKEQQSITVQLIEDFLENI